MKKIIVIIIVISSIWFLGQEILVSPCTLPLRYRIDTVDSEFKVSKDKFTEETKKAANIWNKANKQELLIYDPQGKLSINLIYDERQRLNLAVVTKETALTKTQQTLDQQIAQFREDERGLRKKLQTLNTQIQEWNQKGGAPSDIYNQLLQEQQDLIKEADSLQKRAKDLNVSASGFNTEVSRLNQDIMAFNTKLEVRPEEGIYLPSQNRIEIYFDITNRN